MEIQQRAVELASLFTLGSDLRAGVLERMPPPELKATVMGVVSENKPVGSVQPSKDVCGFLLNFITLLMSFSG